MDEIYTSEFIEAEPNSDNIFLAKVNDFQIYVFLENLDM